MKTRRVFICSPYRGDVEENVMLAREHCRCAVREGYIPIAPHLYFPQFLDDRDQHERNNGLSLGLELLKDCDEIWIYPKNGHEITKGMEMEMETAKCLNIPMRFMLPAKTLTKCNG